LVLGPRHVVLAVFVAPINFTREVTWCVEVPRVGRVFDLTFGEEGVFDTAASLGGEQAFELFFFFTFSCGLREGIDGLVIKLRFLFLFSSLMLKWLTPCILRHNPGAVRLNIKVINTTANTEEAIFTPMTAPRVSNSPELLSLLSHTVANDADIVHDFHITGLIAEDTPFVVFFEFEGDSGTASDWTSLVDFLHHGVFAGDGAILFRVVHFVLFGDEAGFAGVAVSALHHGRAFFTVGVAAAEVD